MVDSGAFTVWSKGLKIDFDAYIDFCRQAPDADYYVNLDVIPGTPGSIDSTKPGDIQDACRQSWKNYQKMLKYLPIEKVIPVFHQHDRPEWLEKYLTFGTPYIGVSPANDRTTSQKLGWMNRDVIERVTDSSGKPIVKTHGFAVTSFRLMKGFPWYSVDSSTWVKLAGYGVVFIPRLGVDGKWDYSLDPLQLAVSPRSPMRKQVDKHYFSLTPEKRKIVDRYFHELGIGIGKWELVTGKKPFTAPKQSVSFGLVKHDSNLCYDKKKTGQDIQVVENGVAVDRKIRAWLNARFLSLSNEALPVEHIYFAGSVHFDELEPKLRKRLISYHYVLTGMRKEFDMHTELIRNWRDKNANRPRRTPA